MRVVILTSSRRGRAARCLPALCASRSIEVVAVIVAKRVAAHNTKRLLGKLKKTARIGPLGALNGLRLRRWYADDSAEDVMEVAQRLGVPLVQVETINSEETRRRIAGADADLGLSLGNARIERAVFSVPRHGTINVHEELLPEFRGAQSVIWPIFEGQAQTGLTIHQMDQRIDGGPILWRETFDIEFRASLRETVLHNRRRIAEKLPAALVQVCENYSALRAKAESQPAGRSYTTPSFWQFLRMVRAHRAGLRRS